jgi:hypothetical protein
MGGKRMQKLFFSALAAVVVLMGGIASGQELGNPAKLIGKGEIDVGVQGVMNIKQSYSNYDLNRTFSNGMASTSRNGADFYDDAFYMATITYGLFDKLNIFARLGVANGGEWKDYHPGNNWKADLGTNFVWAVGAKLDALKMDNGFGIIMAGQYLRYDDRDVSDWRSEETGQSAGQLGWNTNDTIDFWQADFVVTAKWTLGMFTPYVGAGYSWYRVNYEGEWTHQDPRIGWIKYDSIFDNDQPFSGLLGFDVDIGDHIKINAQGTFVSRTAVTLGMSYCF